MRDTITLTERDSGLTVSAFGDEKVEVSGGRHLEALKWQAHPSKPGVYTVDLSGEDLPHGVPALHYGDAMDRQRATLARYPNANVETDLFPKGYITEKTAWSPPEYRGVPCDPRQQCGKSLNLTWAAPAEEWHGMYQVAPC